MAKLRNINAFYDEVRANLENVTQKSARRIYAAARRTSPVVTGRLKAGWEVVKEGRAKYGVKNEVPYATYVENGTPKMDGKFMLRTAIRNEVLRLKRTGGK